MNVPRTVVIHLVPGEPRLHLWCDRCLTSAAYEIDVYSFSPWTGDEPPSVIGTFRRCDRCDEP